MRANGHSARDREGVSTRLRWPRSGRRGCFEWERGDEPMWSFIISPEDDDRVDLRHHVRDRWREWNVLSVPNWNGSPSIITTWRGGSESGVGSFTGPRSTSQLSPAAESIGKMAFSSIERSPGANRPLPARLRDIVDQNRAKTLTRESVWST